MTHLANDPIHQWLIQPMTHSFNDLHSTNDVIHSMISIQPVIPFTNDSFSQWPHPTNNSFSHCANLQIVPIQPMPQSPMNYSANDHIH